MKVTLLKPLTVGDQPRAVGDVVEVDDITVAWLAEPARGVIAPLPVITGSRKSTGTESAT